MFGETTISYVMIWNHPIETTIYKQMFQVPGRTITPIKWPKNHMGLKWDESSPYTYKGAGSNLTLHFWSWFFGDPPQAQSALVPKDPGVS